MPSFCTEEAHEQWCDREDPQPCVPLPIHDEEPTERVEYCLGCGRPVGESACPCGVAP